MQEIHVIRIVARPQLVSIHSSSFLLICKIWTWAARFGPWMWVPFLLLDDGETLEV